MRKCILSAALGLLLIPIALATDLDDGFCRIAWKDPALTVTVQSGKSFGVGTKEQVNIQKVTLTSHDNWNERFYLRIETPYDQSLDKRPWYLLVANSKTYRQIGASSSQKKISSLGFKIHGRDEARDIAQYFSIKPRYRKHPGHQFAVKFESRKNEFNPGEDVSATLTIQNVGTNVIAFRKGGRNRATRDNQYEFVARHKGKQVHDIGQAGHSGGLSFPKVLKPGDIFEDSVNLSKWFDFKKPGTYEVLGTYVMEFRDPDDDSNFPIWEDRVCAEFTVRIKKPESASNKQVEATRQ